MKILDRLYKIPTPVKSFIILAVIISPVCLVCSLINYWIDNPNYDVICQRELEQGQYYGDEKYLRVIYGVFGFLDTPASNQIELSRNGVTWDRKSWWNPTLETALEDIGLDEYDVLSSPNPELCESISNEMKRPEFKLRD